MTTTRPLDRILERAVAAGASVTTAQAQQLLAYYDLLERWNRTINLTALKLEGYPVETVERLIVEPIVLKGLIGHMSGQWLDLGSGGGSPAIPLKICWPEAPLTMVESRSRKTAFLREAVRVLGLHAASVWSGRIENLSDWVPLGTIQLVTLRAVRTDDRLFELVSQLLESGGKLAIFGRVKPPDADSSPLRLHNSARLPAPGSAVHLFVRI